MFLLISGILLLSVSAQDKLKIINDPKDLIAAINNKPQLAMVELKSIVPNIKYDLRYATANNFTGVRLYPSNTQTTYLRKAPAEALARVAKELNEKGMGILVWDAFRPYHITVRFWELIKDERYVANPSKGSGHNRGIAIDFTLYNLKTGELIDMPTGYDDFSEKAFHGFPTLSESKKNNREFLRELMEKNGFIKFDTEWWHYYWPNGDEYDVLDFSFKQLKKITRDTTQ